MCYNAICVAVCSICNTKCCYGTTYFYYCARDNCVIVSGRIKGAARATNVMYPCGFICNPVVLTLRRMNLIKNNYNGTGTRQRSLKAKHCY